MVNHQHWNAIHSVVYIHFQLAFSDILKLFFNHPLTRHSSWSQKKKGRKKKEGNKRNKIPGMDTVTCRCRGNTDFHSARTALNAIRTHPPAAIKLHSRSVDSTQRHIKSGPEVYVGEKHLHVIYRWSCYLYSNVGRLTHTRRECPFFASIPIEGANLLQGEHGVVDSDVISLLLFRIVSLFFTQRCL